jgi:hypothetical protein
MIPGISEIQKQVVIIEMDISLYYANWIGDVLSVITHLMLP